MEMSQKVVKDVPGFFKVYADGSISRYEQPLMAASEQEPVGGTRSKDIVIDPATGAWVRLFLPDDVPHGQKLPLLFYFHGGGFCCGSTAFEIYHSFLRALARAARVLVISVDYRLTTEHRLPAAYDDCCYAVEWAALGGGKAEPWLESYGDYSRCFMGGESAGGNIVHTVGTMTAGRDLGPLHIKGLIAIHPFFGSEERIESEKSTSETEASEIDLSDLLWRMSLPLGSNRDHPASNPEGPLSPDLRDVPLPPVLVAVAGLDRLKPRGLLYYELLQRCGKEAEMFDAEGQIHAYHIFYPRSEATRLLQDRMSQFIHRFDV